MTSSMQLKLDPNLDFQLNAINAVIGLLNGIDRHSVDLATEFGYEIVPNLPPSQILYERDLFNNLLRVQGANKIIETDRSAQIESDDGMVLDLRRK